MLGVIATAVRISFFSFQNFHFLFSLVECRSKEQDDEKLMKKKKKKKLIFFSFLCALSEITQQVAVIALGYISVGVAGYAAFPLTVGGNVLNSFSESDGLMQGVRGVVGEKKEFDFFFKNRFGSLPPLFLSFLLLVLPLIGELFFSLSLFALTFFISSIYSKKTPPKNSL